MELAHILTDCDGIGYVGWNRDYKMIFGRSYGIQPLGTELGYFLTYFVKNWYVGSIWDSKMIEMMRTMFKLNRV